ncbi:MAG: hypothetical protein WCI40_08575 [Verrucomicrobiota bacterium]
MFEPPGECPVCGFEVHEDAKACPECGADERSGWREIDFSEEAFNHEEFLAEEFGQDRKPAVNPLWTFTALLLVLGALGLVLLRGRIF